MKLIPPGDETVMVRRAKKDNDPARPWHFLKPGGTQLTRCGRLLMHVDELEYAELGSIRGKLCGSCWPFGVEKGSQEKSKSYQLAFPVDRAAEVQEEA